MQQEIEQQQKNAFDPELTPLQYFVLGELVNLGLTPIPSNRAMVSGVNTRFLSALQLWLDAGRLLSV